MNISTVQNNNTNFCCLYKPQKKLSVSELQNIWNRNDYRAWLLQQPAQKAPNILIANMKQLCNSSFDIKQAIRDVNKSFTDLLLNK